MACGDQLGWLVCVIEEMPVGQLWLFWRAEIGQWVSDLDRATLYPTDDAARDIADERSAEEGIDARVIRRRDVV